MNDRQIDLEALEVKKLSGTEHFRCNQTTLTIDVAAFWRWAYSDLASNNLRGHLAEFLVASALNETQKPRSEWDTCDIRLQSGARIEVKSAAYLQSWRQEKLSDISFSVAPSRLDNTKPDWKEQNIERHSDIYVFCLLDQQENKETLDPTDLDKWRFFILLTKTLNEKLGSQKTLSLNGLLKLKPAECSYGGIAQNIERLFKPRA